MSADRAIANALADGINCIAQLASALDKGGGEQRHTAMQEWPDTLQAMERALDSIRAKEVTTSLVVHEDDVERVRRTRALMSEWLKHGHASQELRALTEAILQSFGLPTITQEDNASKGVP